ncbi:hypothetical protein KM043_000824 [Ampulex compressa]|nr:hypothetical protein KM043_000824 [Ampulex compressa]
MSFGTNRFLRAATAASTPLTAPKTSQDGASRTRRLACPAESARAGLRVSHSWAFTNTSLSLQLRRPTETSGRFSPGGKERRTASSDSYLRTNKRKIGLTARREGGVGGGCARGDSDEERVVGGRKMEQSERDERYGRGEPGNHA